MKFKMSEEPSKSEEEAPSPEKEIPPTQPEPEPSPSQPSQSDAWNSLKDIVKLIGEWAWLLGLINGIVYIIVGIVGIAGGGLLALAGLYGFGIIAGNVWNIIGGIINIILSLFIVLPRFSMKCKNEDWDYLLNDVLLLGNIRFPWMLIWGILLEIFGVGWGGLAVFIPALILLFAGPKPYEWTAK